MYGRAYKYDLLYTFEDEDGAPYVKSRRFGNFLATNIEQCR